MTVTENLDAARAGLVMINPAPYNAEAPPGALAADITPTELHYVRSNFPVPTHDGALEIGGAVDNPMTLTLDDLRSMPAQDAIVTLECAGNGRLEMRPLPTGEPWGDYAASTARWTGVPLHEVLQQVGPHADGVDVRFEGADHGAYHLKPVLADTDRGDLSFVRALPLATAVDPAAGILIAYEMNGRELPVVQVPVLTPRLSSYWLALVTDVDITTGRNLIDSMGTEVVVTDDAIRDVVPLDLVPYQETVRRALEDDRQTEG